MLSEFELGLAVGLFEGEGTITTRAKAGKGVLSLQLASTDEDTVRRFATLVGGRVYGPYGPYQPNRSAHWRWDAYGAEAARVLTMFLPHLGARRAERARRALSNLERRQAEPFYRCSRKGIGGRPTHRALNGAEYVRERMRDAGADRA